MLGRDVGVNGRLAANKANVAVRAMVRTGVVRNNLVTGSTHVEAKITSSCINHDEFGGFFWFWMKTSILVKEILGESEPFMDVHCGASLEIKKN